MKTEFWKTKLRPFDLQMFRMVESMTGRKCEPKNGGDHFFFEADYSEHNDPQFILALWDAIVGRAGKRLIEIDDQADRHSLYVRVKFETGECKEAAFIPKFEKK